MNIIFTGPCTVETSDVVRRQLLTALESQERVEVSFAKVESVDVAFFQLLMAAHKECSRKEQEMVFSRDLPASFAHMAHICGMGEIGATALCANVGETPTP